MGNVITWQNVPGADLNGPLAGIRSAADLFNRAGDSARGVVTDIGTTNDAVEKLKQDEINRRVTQQMLSTTDPVAYQKMLADGLAQGNLPDGSHLNLSPEMQLRLDARKDFLTKRAEDAYKQDIERQDNASVSVVARAVGAAQDPKSGYGQQLLNDYKGSAKGFDSASKVVADAYHQPQTTGGRGSGTYELKLKNYMIDAEAAKQAEAILGKGDRPEGMIAYRGLPGQYSQNPDPEFGNAVQAKTFEILNGRTQGLWGQKMNPLGQPGGAPPSGAQGSGGGQQSSYGGGGQGQQQGAGGGAPGFGGGNVFDTPIPGVPAISPVTGLPLQPPPDTNDLVGDGLGKRFGNLVSQVQATYPDAMPPPGYNWEGKSDGVTPTMGAVYDWNDKYMRPVSEANGDGGKPGLGTTATGPYQITNTTRAEFAQKLWGDNWRSTKMTPENEDRLAESIFKQQGYKAWEALKKYAPSTYEGKSFRELAPMIRYLDGGVVPDSYKKDIATLHQNLTDGVSTLDDSGKIALKARQQALAGQVDAGKMVHDGLTAIGEKEIDGGEINKFLDKTQKLANKFNVKLSQAEQAQLLLASTTKDSGYLDLSVSDLTPNITVDEGKLENLIKDFGKSQEQVNRLYDLDRSVTHLSQLSGRYDNAAKDVTEAMKFAKTSPDAQAALPAKFAMLDRISNDIKKKIPDVPDTTPSLVSKIKTLNQIERAARDNPPDNLAYAKANPEALKSFKNAIGRSDLTDAQALDLIKAQQQKPAAAPASSPAAKIDQLLATPLAPAAPGAFDSPDPQTMSKKDLEKLLKMVAAGDGEGDNQ